MAISSISPVAGVIAAAKGNEFQFAALHKELSSLQDRLATVPDNQAGKTQVMTQEMALIQTELAHLQEPAVPTVQNHLIGAGDPARPGATRDPGDEMKAGLASNAAPAMGTNVDTYT